MNNNIFKGLTAAFLLVILSFSVSAAPGVPHQFFGDVLVNGKAAPDTYLVEAVINSVPNSVAKQTFVIDGQYGFDPIFYIEDPNNDRLGDKITFYVGKNVDSLVKAAEYTFNNGESTNLELAITVSTPPPHNGGGSSGGSSRSSGGSSYIPPTTTVADDNETDDNETNNNETVVVECDADWICTSWGECINGQQTRTCADKEQCPETNETEASMPAEKQSCEVTVAELYGDAPDAKNTILNRITGAVVGGGVASWGTLLGLLLVIGGVIGYVKTRGKADKKPKKKK